MVQLDEDEPLDGHLLCVEKASSAFITHSVFKGGMASAISADPQAGHIFVSDSVIGGCGSGGPNKDPFYEPGECGAIEAWCIDDIEEGERKSYSSTVKFTLLRNTITNCFGPAVSHRDKFTLVTRTGFEKRKSFKWPGKSVVKMQDNKINKNGLARPRGCIPDGEVMFRNAHSDYAERDGDFDDSDY